MQTKTLKFLGIVTAWSQRQDDIGILTLGGQVWNGYLRPGPVPRGTEYSNCR